MRIKKPTFPNVNFPTMYGDINPGTTAIIPVNPKITPE